MGCRIYVGHLTSRASERDIEHFFRGYGRIRSVLIQRDFAFVDFDSSRDAEDAVHELNGRELMGEHVVIEMSRRGPYSGPSSRFDHGDRGYDRGGPPLRNSRYGPPVQTRHRLLVKNLSTRCSWQDLKDLMRHVGEVCYVEAHNAERNKAVVCFSRRDDLKRAIDKYQGKDINGRKIKLVDDTARSRSRTRSPTRRRAEKIVGRYANADDRKREDRQRDVVNYACNLIHGAVSDIRRALLMNRNPEDVDSDNEYEEDGGAVIAGGGDARSRTSDSDVENQQFRVKEEQKSQGGNRRT